MIFSNVVKSENDIEFAAKNGVLYTSSDTFDELIKIKEIAPQMKSLWRFTIFDKSSKSISFGDKFGDDVSDLEKTSKKFEYIKN